MIFLDRLADLSDQIRSRILLTLEGQELSVSELQAVLQLPQSTVSRHLNTLQRGGWVKSRPDGPSQRYRLAVDALPQVSQRLWELVREEAAHSAWAQRDRRRLQAVLARRRSRSREFFASAAGRWERLREELFGHRAELLALLGLLEPDWVVGDLGCGAGHLAAAVAPWVARVVAVDESEAMLTAARHRCAGLANVEFRLGELELLPVNEMELDLAVIALVLPYVSEPGRLLAEAARALQPGGRLVVVDLAPHDRTEFAHTLGHLRFGVEADRLTEWFRGAGLVAGRYLPLAPDPSATGPELFLAAARKPG
jgi:ArsR family transcriptional regulator